MDKLFLRMEHIPKQIFEELNFESLMNARLVSPSWEQFIDNRAHQLSLFKKEISDMEEECKDGQTPFHLACQNGQEYIAKIIMKNSAEFNIDLNAKDNLGMTAFHELFLLYLPNYRNGHAEIAEMLIRNSVEFNIDLNAKNSYGYTAFHYACSHGLSKHVEILIKNSTEFNIDLNVKSYYTRTAFHDACYLGKLNVVEIMINNSESFNLDLTARTNRGNTGFQLAQKSRKTGVVNMIRTKMPQIAF